MLRRRGPPPDATGNDKMRALFLKAVGLLPPQALKRLGRWQSRNALVRSIVLRGRRWIGGQDVTIKYGVGAGLRLHARHANPGHLMGTAEPLTQEALQRCVKEGSIVYDIGANVGFFALISARLTGPAGHVYAFEPVPECAALVRHNAALNAFSNITLLECAVFSAGGRGELALAPERTMASLTSTGARRDTIAVIEVDMISIDELVAQRKLPPPDVVKMDIEGAEVEALRGMARTLKVHGPALVCETHGTHEGVAALLDELGYRHRMFWGAENLPGEVGGHMIAAPMSKRDIFMDGDYDPGMEKIPE